MRVRELAPVCVPFLNRPWFGLGPIRPLFRLSYSFSFTNFLSVLDENEGLR